MSKVICFLKGGVIGVANIIPGLSGGTMAIILGVYQKIVESISSFTSFKWSDMQTSFWFLFYIGLGAFVGVFCFSFVMENLLLSYQEIVSYFFIGVVVGSVPYIVITESINLRRPFLLSIMACFIVVGLLFLWVKFLFVSPSSISTQPSSLYVFFSV